MKVYKYGARAAGAGVRAQMRLGHRYYNALVEAENARRQTGWGGESPPAPPHPECDVEDCPECIAHWRAVTAAVYAIPPLDLCPLRAQFVAEGLYNGTYLLIERAFSAAYKATKATSRVSFRPWRKGAVAGVQVQLPYQGNKKSASLYRIEKAPDPRTGRRARNGRGRHTLRIRLGSLDKNGAPCSGGHTPLWSDPIPFELHRPIKGTVTWVKVRVQYVADREVWSIAFDCRNTPVGFARDATDGVVAVDVSWRRTDQGTRIAYAQDPGGAIDELVLGARWEGLSKRADGIRSNRDTHLNALQAADGRFARVRSWAGAQRKARKLAAAGDEPGAFVEAALRRDRHLWQYEAGCRRRVVAVRRAKLREWVRLLRDRYAEVVVKDSSHKTLKEDHRPVSEGGLPRGARRRGHHCAPGETVDLLCSVFGRDAVSVVSARNTTDQCPECDHINDHGAETVVVCEQCGASIDRDNASTRNMLRLYNAGETKKPTARKTTAKFAKKHARSEQGTNASPTV